MLGQGTRVRWASVPLAHDQQGARAGDGVTTALSVSAGSGSTCASLVDGTKTRCWGFNDSGPSWGCFLPRINSHPFGHGWPTSNIGIGNSHACARSMAQARSSAGAATT